MPLRQVIVLKTSTPHNILVETAQRRMLDALAGKEIAVDVVDGAVNHERRDFLFGVRGSRLNVYPQAYISDSGSGTTWTGGYEEFESQIDCDALPCDILMAHPEIAKDTFTSIYQPEQLIRIGLAASTLAALQRLIVAKGTCLQRIARPGNSLMHSLSPDLAEIVATHLNATHQKRSLRIERANKLDSVT